jgi:spermidine synthase
MKKFKRRKPSAEREQRIPDGASGRTGIAMFKAYYLLVSVIAGAAVLALEVLAIRATAPAVGSGSATWAAMLATALGTLAIGNLLGGLLSERADRNPWIIWALAIAAAYLVAFSQVHRPLLQWSAEMPLLFGAIIAAAITQAVPLAMLGMMTPIVLKYGGNRSGRWAGIVLAAGCSGGIAGALVTGFLLLPGLGLARSFLSVALLLTGSALPGAWVQRRWLVGILLLTSLVCAGWCWGRQAQDGVLESLHGQLEVRSTASGRVLLIDGLPQTGFPEQLVPGEALRQGYLLEIALTLRPRTQTALVVGLGAGLAPRILSMHGICCETIEIDPAVVEIARRQFGFKESVIVGDGRSVLSCDDRRFDLIFVDVCTTDRLPWHLFTVESMRLIRERLTPAGILAIQFIGDDGPWSASVLQTVDTAFGQGRSLALAPAMRVRPVGPRWVFAFRDMPPGPRGELASRLRPTSWTQLALPATGSALTDDHFAAELDWAETARRWRSLNSVVVGKPTAL